MIKGIEKLRNLKILESKSFGAFKKDLKKKKKKLEKKLILSSFINMNRKKQNEKKNLVHRICIPIIQERIYFY